MTHTIQVSHHGEWVACLGLVHKHHPPVNSTVSVDLSHSHVRYRRCRGPPPRRNPVLTKETKGCAYSSPFVMSSRSSVWGQCYSGAQRALLLCSATPQPGLAPALPQLTTCLVAGSPGLGAGSSPWPRRDQVSRDGVGSSGGSQHFSGFSLIQGGECAYTCWPRALEGRFRCPAERPQ